MTRLSQVILAIGLILIPVLGHAQSQEIFEIVKEGTVQEFNEAVEQGIDTEVRNDSNKIGNSFVKATS